MRNFRACLAFPRNRKHLMGISPCSISFHNGLESKAFLYHPSFLNTPRAVPRICWLPATSGPLHVLSLVLEILVYSTPYLDDPTHTSISGQSSHYQGDLFKPCRPCHVASLIASITTCPSLSGLLLWCLHISVWLSD